MVVPTSFRKLSEALLQCRADGNLTQRDVAAAIGVSAAAICHIERGMAEPRPTTRVRLLAFLKQSGYHVEDAA